MNNIYLINKPAELTSFDIVAKVRKAKQIRRTGHAGTLDPFATGLLIVCTGKFTRLVDYIHYYPKTYKSTFQLGINTDSDDITGTVLSQSDCTNIEIEQIYEYLKKMQGEIYQQPCSISAKRVNGQRLYKINRGSEKVKAKPVKINIHKISVESIQLPFVNVEITCSTGTYIRAIARDLGQSLGCGAIVTKLQRTEIGPYSVEHANSIDNKQLNPVNQLGILPELDAITLMPQITKRIQMGNIIKINNLIYKDLEEKDKIVRLFSPYFKNLIAICRISSYDRNSYNIKAEKVFENEI